MAKVWSSVFLPAARSARVYFPAKKQFFVGLVSSSRHDPCSGLSRLSVWTGLLTARSCAFIPQILNWIFDFGTEKLTRLSRNWPASGQSAPGRAYSLAGYREMRPRYRFSGERSSVEFSKWELFSEDFWNSGKEIEWNKVKNQRRKNLKYFFEWSPQEYKWMFLIKLSPKSFKIIFHTIIIHTQKKIMCVRACVYPWVNPLPFIY